MQTAEAHVRTERASRYLVQLCKHFNHQGQHLRHRPHARHGDDTRARPEPQADQMHVEWSETRGMVDFGWGQCTIQATPGTLTLRVEAADETNLQVLQDLVAGHLDRFGRRDRLKVQWHWPEV